MKVWMLIIVMIHGSPDVDAGKFLSKNNAGYVRAHQYKVFTKKSFCTDLRDVIIDQRESFTVEPFHVYSAHCMEMKL